MTPWKYAIYYGDGSVWWSDRDGPWDAAPADDVQVVMLYLNKRKGYRRIVQGADEYRLPELGKTVKRGKWADGRKYAAIVRRAMREG